MVRKSISIKLTGRISRIPGFRARAEAVPGRKVVQRVVLSLVLTVVLIFAAGYIIAPLRLVKEYKILSEEDTLLRAGFDPIIENPELLPLVKENSYKKALLELASKDSIQLVVDLRDSMVCLAIHGVIINRVIAAGMTPDPVLKILTMQEYRKIFSRPLKIVRQHASIVKEPIVVRQAPRDTLEAFLNAYLPDTLVQRPAFMELQLEQGIRIIFEQDRETRFRDLRVRTTFRLSLSARNAARYLSEFFSREKMKYSPRITIRMNADDIRAIYRALPSNPYFVLAF